MDRSRCVLHAIYAHFLIRISLSGKTVFEDTSSIDELYWNGTKWDLGNRNYAYIMVGWKTKTARNLLTENLRYYFFFHSPTVVIFHHTQRLKTSYRLSDDMTTI